MSVCKMYTFNCSQRTGVRLVGGKTVILKPMFYKAVAFEPPQLTFILTDHLFILAVSDLSSEEL